MGTPTATTRLSPSNAVNLASRCRFARASTRFAWRCSWTTPRTSAASPRPGCVAEAKIADTRAGRQSFPLDDARGGVHRIARRDRSSSAGVASVQTNRSRRDGRVANARRVGRREVGDVRSGRRGGRCHRVGVRARRIASRRLPQPSRRGVRVVRRRTLARDGETRRFERRFERTRGRTIDAAIDAAIGADESRGRRRGRRASLEIDVAGKSNSTRRPTRRARRRRPEEYVQHHAGVGARHGRALGEERIRGPRRRTRTRRRRERDVQTVAHASVQTSKR